MFLRRIERGARRAGIGLAGRLLASQPLGPEAVELAALERIVVVRQDRRLGNLVLLTSLLLGLRRAAPRASITVVAPHAFAPVLDPHPAVDRIIPLDHRRMLRRPWEMASWRESLRAIQPQLAVDASPVHSASFLNGIITWGSGAPWRLGYDREDAAGFLNLRVEPGPPAHESVLLHDLLRHLRPDLPPAPLPQIESPDADLALAARAYRRWGSGEAGPVVGIHPGGRRRKRWPLERFEAVARMLAARGVVVIVFSGPAERLLIDAMAPPGPRRVYAPPTDVRGLRALVSGLDAFVSGDCGPMHLAAALGVPCVAIFRLGDHARYGPLGGRHRVLHRPGGDVEPEEVVAVVSEVLAHRPLRERRDGSEAGGVPAGEANRSGAREPHPTSGAGQADRRSSPGMSESRR
jgi:ADP-heptose:LPS heptosyltransferase